MVLGSYACQSPYVNSLANYTEQNKLAGIYSPAKKFNIGIDEASIKALIAPKAPT